MSTSHYYIVNTYIDGEYISGSDVFRSRRRAQALADHMTSTIGTGEFENVEYIVFKCRPMPPKIYLDRDEDTTTTGEASEIPSLEGMYFEDYGKGFMLFAPETSPHYGEKYFLNGWWNARQQGWFFKKEYFDELFSLGAQYVVDSSSGKVKSRGRSTRNTTTSTSAPALTVRTSTRSGGTSKRHVTFDFSGMTFETFGKGFILRASDDHPLFGEKYLLSGWWNAKQQGWFFKSEFESELIDHGAQFISLEDDESEQYTEDEVAAATAMTGIDLSMMTLEEYGRGYVLFPPTNHPLFGEKYFRDGWWRPDLGGWFFRSRFIDGLISDGAMLVQEIV